MQLRRSLLIRLCAASLLAIAGGLALVPASAVASDVPVVQLSGPAIVESSGLAASVRHPGVAWTHNDSGGGNRVFAIDIASGATLATVELAGVVNVDWEAIAMGRDEAGAPALFVGETGTSLPLAGDPVVYRFPEPERLEDQVVEAEAITLRFPAERPDVEALLVDPRDGRLYVVSKDRSIGTVFVAEPTTDGPWPLTPVGTASAMVSDGSFLPDGRVVLRTTRRAYLYDGPGGERLDALELPQTRVGESLAVTADGTALVVGEEGVASRLWRVALPASWVSGPSPVPTVADTSGSTAAAAPGSPEAAAAEAQPSGSPLAADPSTSASGLSPSTAAVGVAGLTAVLFVGVLLARRRDGRGRHGSGNGRAP